MKVCVTGSRGFIGRYVSSELKRHHHEVFHYDERDGHDVCSWSNARAVMETCDAVIHLAGVLGTSELFDHPNHAIDVNVRGAANFLRACSEVDAGYVGITMPHVWDNVYQATKKCAEDLATAYHRHYSVPVAHVRAYNVFGPHQKLGPVRKMIPTFSRAAWTAKPIEIWGSGSQTVDLVYVEDVAKILVESMKFGDNKVIDAGTGVAYTVNQCAQMVLHRANSWSEVQHFPMRKGENAMTNIVAEGEGWDRLGWKPEFHQADLDRTIDSYRIG